MPTYYISFRVSSPTPHHLYTCTRTDGPTSIWRWRNQYGEVLGGLGTGIGDADRGVICGREGRCLGARDREHEMDCDAEDARDAADCSSSSPPSSVHNRPPSSTASSLAGSLHSASAGSEQQLGSSLGATAAYSPPGGHRTPSPAVGPGYARHEIEGIGGVVKTKLVRMVRVGACVPEWEDEKAKSEILGREVQGKVRSWCGWCWRVIPGKKDYDAVREKEKGADREKKVSGAS